MNDLKQLLHDTADTTPPGGVDIGEVMRVGQRRRARRHWGVVAAAVAVTGVVAGGVALVPFADGGSDPADYANRPVGPVISLDEAKPAMEGTHYRILGRRDAEHPGSTRGVQNAGVTDDGRVVLTEDQGDPATATRVGLADPETGEEQWLPAAPGTISHPVSLGADRLVFRTGTKPGQSANELMKDFSVLVFDRGSSTWSTLRWPGLPGDAVNRGPFAHDGRLYVALENGDTYDGLADLWSVALDDTADARDEQTAVGLVNITGDELIWTPALSRPDVSRIHVRNLVTGEERTFDPRTGDECYAHELERIGDSLLLSQFCDGGKGDSGRIQVVTMDGDPVVTVEGDASLSSDGGSMAVLSAGAASEPSGTFMLDPSSGELWAVETGQPTALLRVSRRPVPQGSDLAFLDTMTWSVAGDTGVPEPDDDDVYTSTPWVVEWLG